jgi:hypothetical protein
MDLYNYFNIKKKQINNSSSSSLTIKKRKFDRFKYKNPFSNNFLPNIAKSNYLSVKNKVPLNKKLFFSNNQNLNSIISNSIYQLNYNLLSHKKSTSILNKEIKPVNNQESDFIKTITKSKGKSKKQKNNESRNNDKNANYRRAYSLLGNENSKNFMKTLNVKNNFRSIQNVEDNNTLKEDNDFPKTRSMFMTGMYFLGKTKKYKENYSNRENKENEENNEKEKKINNDFLSFSELIKQIEQNKRKIIDNQNDIEDMIQTAKETHKEIWKCNRFKK